MKNKIICMITVLMLLVPNAIVMAYDAAEDILSRMQGQWYDNYGNAVLDIQGRTLNGCDIIGIYDVAGGRSNFSCIIRIVESEGYRDFPILLKG